ALLPQTGDVPEAARRAKAYLTEAIRHAERLSVGSGHGPVHHFHAWW
ncbi:bifunctional hydroxymethylpyrimidine kinase/phosphomethylpyrimidine kinase, partial [Achromobacter xylosoxidans]